MKTKIALLVLIALYLLSSSAHAEWEFYEKTNVKGRLVEMRSGSIYQVSGITIQVVVEVMPEALVLQDGTQFKLIIDGFDEPLICNQLVAPKRKPAEDSTKPAQPAQVKPEVIQSHIDGDFEGWEGETIFKLDNGQIWQQSSYAYTYHYAYHPEVMIINVKGTWKMKVEGVDEMISVKRLK